jgi:hypothetical protein
MEELLAVLGFGAGATLTIRLTRLLGRGAREALVSVTRAGLRIGDTVARAGGGFARIEEEARTELGHDRQAPPPTRSRRRGRSARGKDVRRIEIATE